MTIETKCIHRWQIESANGPQSSGICYHCGEQRVFYNSNPDITWAEWISREAKGQELNETFIPWGDTANWRQV